MYRMLVGTAGWTHEHYASWLDQTLTNGLLADPETWPPGDAGSVLDRRT